MPPKVPDRIAAALASSWAARVAHVAGHETAERDGVLAVLSGLPAPELSVALVVREPADPLGALAAAERAFARRGLPLGIEIELGRYPSVEQTIQDLGLVKAVSRPAMALAVGDVPAPEPPEGTEIRVVRTSQDLTRVVRIETQAFGTAPEVAKRLIAPQLLHRDDTTLFVASWDGKAVAMAYTHEHEGTLGVFGVGTLPKFRGLGIGTAITAFAIGSSRGADLAWLQPTAMARSVYERMGFEPVAEWEVWVRPRPGAG